VQADASWVLRDERPGGALALGSRLRPPSGNAAAVEVPPISVTESSRSR
jgi:hypothetical protein